MSDEKPEIVAFDFETLYTEAYSLSKMSVFNYVNDPRFDAYLVSVHDKSGPVYIGRPEGFDWSMMDGKVVAAHNMSFDYVVLARLVELGKVPRMPKAAEFACTADMAAWLGVKRDLKTAARYLLGEEVSKATRTAMKGRASADLADNADVLKYAGDDARLCYELAAKYLDQWPEEERRVSTLNREAGIRGIHMDAAMVDAGIATLEPQLQAAMDKIPWVATGDKPLSPNALRKYGQALGLPVPASLAKDSPDFVEWAAKYADQYPWVKAVGEYRSINALLCRVQSLRDGIDRSTGMFPFGIRYMGASTGRFCLPGSAEVLTPTGWRELQHWKGSPIMQWDATTAMRMAPASPNVFDGGSSTSMIRAIGRRVDIVMTPEHSTPYFTSKKKLHVMTASACYGKRIDVPVSGVYAGGNGALSPTEARLLVATQADGCFYTSPRDAAWHFGFKKGRKYTRLTGLLRELGVQHKTREDASGLFVVSVQALDAPWYLSKTFSLGMLLACSAETLEAFMDELVNWDGSHGDGGSTEYSTTHEANARVVQTIAHVTGRRASVVRVDRQDEGWNDSYRVHVVRKKEHQLARIQKWERVSISKRVYCPTTETGFFLCRYRGNIFITGNSGGGGEGAGRFNCQNMPRGAMYGVDLRPMFMAKPGHTFIIADYAQIEARFLLFWVGNTAMLDLMRSGKSVYQAYAEAVGLAAPGSDLKHTDPNKYKYVKACVLGAGYGVGATKFKTVAKTMAGLDLTDEEAVKAVEDYRSSNPLTVSFWREHHNSLMFSARRKDPTHQAALLSGRVISYWEPRMEGREVSVYQTRGVNRTYLYGGKIVENCVQASCRDILVAAWLAVDKAGLPPVTLTVHDEIVMEAKIDEAPQIAKELERLMCNCAPWAEGLPLGVEVTISDRYTK